MMRVQRLPMLVAFSEAIEDWHAVNPKSRGVAVTHLESQPQARCQLQASQIDGDWGVVKHELHRPPD